MVRPTYRAADTAPPSCLADVWGEDSVPTPAGARGRILMSEPHGLAAYTIGMVAALTVGDPFLRLPSQDDDDVGNVRDAAANGAIPSLALIERKLAHVASAKAWLRVWPLTGSGQMRTQRERRRGRAAGADAKEAQRQQRIQAVRAQHSLMSADNPGDVHKLLNAVLAYDRAGRTEQFCHAHLLRPKVRRLPVPLPGRGPVGRRAA